MKKRSFLEKLTISIAMNEESKILKKGKIIKDKKKIVNQNKKN